MNHVRGVRLFWCRMLVISRKRFTGGKGQHKNEFSYVFFFINIQILGSSWQRLKEKEKKSPDPSKEYIYSNNEIFYKPGIPDLTKSDVLTLKVEVYTLLYHYCQIQIC